MNYINHLLPYFYFAIFLFVSNIQSHDIIIHVISVSNREITFPQLSHSHVLVKLQSLIITIHI